MAFQQVPNTVQIEFKYLSNTVPWVTTFYAQAPLGYDATSMDTLADAAETWAEAGIIGYLSSSAAYVGLEVRGLNALNDITASRTPALPVPGLVNDDVLPVNVAFAIQFTAGLTGRSTRGRNYVAGLPEGQAGSREINVLTANGLVSEYDALRAAVIAAGWIPVIVSRFTNLAKRPVGVTYPITNVGYSTLRLATRRSRLNNA